MSNNSSNKQSKSSSLEKRKNKRFAKALSAKYKETNCSVLNISSKGVLLETDTSLPDYLFPISQSIQFELEIDGEWMFLNGTVQWVASYPSSSRVGIFITDAPSPYGEFIKELYV